MTVFGIIYSSLQGLFFSRLLQVQILHCQFSWTVAYRPLQKLLETNSFKYYNLVLVAFDLFSKITHFIKPFKKAYLSPARFPSLRLAQSSFRMWPVAHGMFLNGPFQLLNVKLQINLVNERREDKSYLEAVPHYDQAYVYPYV